MTTINLEKSKTWVKVQQFFHRMLLSEYFVLYLCLFYFVVLIPFVPIIASGRNLTNLFSNIWPLFAIALGQTFVLIIAGIDLSQGSIMAVSSVVGAVIITNQVDPILFTKSPLWGSVVSESGGLLAGQSYAIPVAILAMLMTGVIIGFINGISVAWFKIPAFMVTLVTQIFFSAFAIYLTKSENVIHLPKEFTAIGNGTLFGMSLLPYTLFLTLALAACAHFLLSQTVFGRWLYAIGNNVRTAVVSGVPTEKVVVLAYVFSGFCASFGAVLYTARLEAGRPTLGANLLLDIVGAAVIGGASLSGGKGKVVWTLFGVLFLMLLANSLSLLNVPYFTIYMVKGGVILLAALVDVTRTRILQRNA
ncbi:ABC transporter permease [Ornatilinea apprima]|uniref:ABC transporter permease n=1 Tax=Ornatilinea apprima TaxID=1134406 RepID=UPI0009467A79|nr:ABC transporter permease [Ornatilinea apprima]